MEEEKLRSAIVMQSDFGIDSGLVACMHGVCKMVDPELEIHDITHTLPAFDIKAASYCLQYTVPFWPAGTVFVSVVDPGVGTERKTCVAKLKNGSYVVTPDNGTLSYLNVMIGIDEIRVIDETLHRYPETRDVHVFHGRDVFAYCGAKLAAGVISFEEVGPAYSVEEIVMLDICTSEVYPDCVLAEIQGNDPFGSVELSVTNKEFRKTGFTLGDKLDVRITGEEKEIFHKIIPYEKSFGYVPKGEEVLFNDLAFYVTIACNQDSFVKKYSLDMSKKYKVEIRKAIIE